MTDFVDGPTRSQTVSLKTNKAIFSQKHKIKKKAEPDEMPLHSDMTHGQVYSEGSGNIQR